jgi:hypothetical protein
MGNSSSNIKDPTIILKPIRSLIICRGDAVIASTSKEISLYNFSSVYVIGIVDVVDATSYLILKGLPPVKYPYARRLVGGLWDRKYYHCYKTGITTYGSF